MTAITVLSGGDIGAFIEEVARLRLRVFREYPYLYEGDAAYEHNYLRTLAESPRATLVLAQDGQKVVGASTAMPLLDADPAFVKPFALPDQYYYFGESVLLAPYRGQGLGHAFFDEREKAARRHGFAKACFCAVLRPDGHPGKPADYRDLSSFWRKRGYRLLEGCVTNYAWKDLGDDEETEKPMQFWARELELAPPADLS